MTDHKDIPAEIPVSRVASTPTVSEEQKADPALLKAYTLLVTQLQNYCEYIEEACEIEKIVVEKSSYVVYWNLLNDTKQKGMNLSTNDLINCLSKIKHEENQHQRWKKIMELTDAPDIISFKTPDQQKPDGLCLMIICLAKFKKDAPHMLEVKNIEKAVEDKIKDLAAESARQQAIVNSAAGMQFIPRT